MSALNVVKRDAVPPARNVPDVALAELDEGAGFDDVQLTRSTRIVFAVFLAVVAFCIWASVAELDEVSTGSGKVIPSSREQIIQTLEGGILAELNVAEGDIVEAQEVLARLDPTRSESNVGESAARYYAGLARSTRLQAEVSESDLVFPDGLEAFPDLIEEESRLYRSRRRGLEQTLSGINQSLALVSRELEITQALLRTGAASNVESLRLQRQALELRLKAEEVRSQYVVQAREELAKANEEVVMYESILRGRSDSLSRLALRSPVRGIVKDVAVTTIGGVIPPNGQVMQIVPLDDRLLIEARISPRDIAFIHPGQEAMVKITAYEYSIYGGLKGKVVTISPDTIQDEIKPENVYYRVNIRTDADYLVNKEGARFAIVPGMVASVDIKSGNKTVMDYLLRPFNQAQESLRER
ncbi:MAG: HlyD family type I secretion periplasmic adaptor subunit [Luteimonas sp.]